MLPQPQWVKPGYRSSSPTLGGFRRFSQVVAPYTVVIPFAAAGTAVGGLSDSGLLAMTVASALCAGARALREYVRITSLRDMADRWITCHAGSPPDDQVLRARLSELGQPRLWLQLSSTLHCLERQGADVRWSMRIPNRRRLGAHADLLALLSARLADTSNPPAPRGVAVVHQLLTRGDAPIHNAARAAELTTTLSNALRLLDD